MSDNQAFEFNVKERRRRGYYLAITDHVQKAEMANWHHDEDAEREEVEAAHDLLSEVMGR